MLIRFCLYGFLKNQRYFEPFLFLALLDKGLTYAQIGALLAIDGITTQLLEVPSGAAADLFGRRRSMILSFCAYILSFLALGLAESFAALCGAMVLFGVGEAFRTGTHKALIFAWLSQQGRSGEKTEVYGRTRSWSKYGSAVSALIAAGLVYASSDYSSVFLWSMVPCALSIVNLLGYPASIDPTPERPATFGTVLLHLKASIVGILSKPKLRRMVGESMGFHGLFRASKDYLQPALVVAAVAWFGTRDAAGPDDRTVALLVGGVYSMLHFGSGLASRNAHRFAQATGGNAKAMRWLWGILLLLFGLLAAADAAGLPAVVILGFVVLHLVQNLWRPILTSRIYDEVEEKQGATVLSVESQSQRLGMVILAPLFGALVDAAGGAFWPVAVVGAGVAFVFFWRRPV